MSFHSNFNFFFTDFNDKSLTDLNIALFFFISVRCGPPYDATFSRQSGRLYVNVSWQKDDFIINYFVRYKAMGSLLWSEVSNKPVKLVLFSPENIFFLIVNISKKEHN